MNDEQGHPSQTDGKKTGEGEETVEKVTIRDVWENLWHCRDFELEHFWHRSAFLSGMLLAGFTAYGCLVGNSSSLTDWCSLRKFVLCEAVCLLSATFSVLWILMAKASKYWYEKYESAILALMGWTENPKLFDDSAYLDKDKKHCIAGFGYAEIPRYNDEWNADKKSDDSIWSIKRGAFSPSKITIFIGQLSLVVWLLLGAGHLVSFIFVYRGDWSKFVTVAGGWLKFVTVAIVLLLWILVVIWMKMAPWKKISSILDKFFSWRLQDILRSTSEDGDQKDVDENGNQIKRETENEEL